MARQNDRLKPREEIGCWWREWLFRGGVWSRVASPEPLSGQRIERWFGTREASPTASELPEFAVENKSAACVSSLVQAWRGTWEAQARVAMRLSRGPVWRFANSARRDRVHEVSLAVSVRQRPNDRLACAPWSYSTHTEVPRYLSAQAGIGSHLRNFIYSLRFFFFKWARAI